ncbi:uv-damage endonuclease [Trichoderma arundinaceum]|uniref:Uv-damage endonuclease n=1 Tax=Trichoderma arundinaceum TaxID=490622 RepID=A0A395NJG0_TRIAR|nr:uv-damage endonuclease [Trichoderma arundinaceum]
MAPKRKKAELFVADPPAAKVRRSSRKTNGVVSQQLESPQQGDEKKDSLGLVGSPSSPQEAFERTMRELGEMGLKLQSAVKRQRLAVETSDLSKCDPEKVREEAFKTRPMVARTARAGHEKNVEAKPVEQPSGDVKMEQADVSEEKADAEAVERSARRPPPVNSGVLPLPWRGRLGYTPDVQRGQKFVQELGLANARDIVKMLRWNDKYGIKFMRLSSEMFPFASHEEHGYKLAPFAADVLAEAGKVAAELGHRLTTHPGQYTQIASPRKEVVTAAFRDLEYHDEMLSLLKLPEQMNRDAIMILHMGGVYGDKAATLDRFRENYAKLSEGVKMRLVLENDDVSWSVHDLLPICEELNIPLVLDYHHHNIVFDSSIREGTLDIMDLYDRIANTWTRKNIKQKMHYSEPTADAVTPRERRKHSARVKTLPPCAADMDLMIEAKDKEQAVFELMRIFRLPGWSLFNDVIPYERDDEPRRETGRGAKKGKKSSAVDEMEDDPSNIISPEELGMGGRHHRVYWPPGMEEWLRPRKREVNKKGKANDGGDE